MSAAMLFDWAAQSESRATVALVCAVAGGLCVVLAIGFLIADHISERPGSISMTSDAPTVPEHAGLQATALVTVGAERWVPAAILQLSCTGRLAVIDRRTVDLGQTGVWDRSVLWLEYTEDPGAIALLRSAGEPGQRLIRALYGGTPRLGEQVELMLTDAVAARLGDLSIAGYEQSRAAYAFEPLRDMRGGRASVVTFLAGAAGLAAVVLALVERDGVVAGIGLGVLATSVVTYAAASIMRMPLPGDALETLNETGEYLRANAEWRRAEVAGAECASVSEVEQVLPWAVLFDLGRPVERLGELIDVTGIVPTWYRSDAPATGRRVVSCIDDLVARMRTPLAPRPY
ncbi:hypothetical protein [Agromyces binzhouensis]|uniref:hypothetical protein n=1 Tax=Agromyces binzhouensis TaxID=1817495 RepID=UPI0036271B15